MRRDYRETIQRTGQQVSWVATELERQQRFMQGIRASLTGPGNGLAGLEWLDRSDKAGDTTLRRTEVDDQGNEM